MLRQGGYGLRATISPVPVILTENSLFLFKEIESLDKMSYVACYEKIGWQDYGVLILGSPVENVLVMFNA